MYGKRESVHDFRDSQIERLHLSTEYHEGPVDNTALDLGYMAMVEGQKVYAQSMDAYPGLAEEWLYNGNGPSSNVSPVEQISDGVQHLSWTPFHNSQDSSPNNDDHRTPFSSAFSSSSSSYYQNRNSSHRLSSLPDDIGPGFESQSYSLDNVEFCGPQFCGKSRGSSSMPSPAMSSSFQYELYPFENYETLLDAMPQSPTLQTLPYRNSQSRVSSSVPSPSLSGYSGSAGPYQTPLESPIEEFRDPHSFDQRETWMSSPQKSKCRGPFSSSPVRPSERPLKSFPSTPLLRNPSQMSSAQVDRLIIQFDESDVTVEPVKQVAPTDPYHHARAVSLPSTPGLFSPYARSPITPTGFPVSSAPGAARARISMSPSLPPYAYSNDSRPSTAADRPPVSSRRPQHVRHYTFGPALSTPESDSNRKLLYERRRLSFEGKNDQDVPQNQTQDSWTTKPAEQIPLSQPSSTSNTTSAIVPPMMPNELFIGNVDTPSSRSATQGTLEQVTLQLKHHLNYPTPSPPLPPGPFPSTFEQDDGSNTDTRENVRRYLGSRNRLQLGEKRVLVLSPQIATRSYRNEKRLLCPQPMALVLGVNWWLTASNGASDIAGPLQYPPEVQIALSTDDAPGVASHPTVWIDEGGSAVLKKEGKEIVVAGRALAKSLYVGKLEVTDIEAREREKREGVRAIVSIFAPETDSAQQKHLLGTFLGNPIAVVSKPSKSRQQPTSLTTLKNGSLVSLYNRIRSCSGSTHYLGTSGEEISFPHTDWSDMTDGQQPFLLSGKPKQERATFTAKTNSWDAFVIYAVEVGSSFDHDAHSSVPFGYPRPPTNATIVKGDDRHALYFNQPVVLQCFSTGVVSPVLVIRKVEGRSSATIGGSLDGYTPPASETRGLSCVPGEKLGETVAQFRSAALQLYTDDKEEAGCSTTTFLACLGDSVGLNRVRSTQSCKFSSQGSDENPILHQPGVSANPQGPSSFISSPEELSKHLLARSALSPVSFHVAPEAMSRYDIDTRRPKRSVSSNNVKEPYPTQSVRPPSALARLKQRGLSLNDLASIQLPSINPASNYAQASSVDCGEHCVWTFVAVEVARHTFYDASNSSSCSTTNKGGSRKSAFITGTPIGPDLPRAFGYIPSRPNSVNPLAYSDCTDDTSEQAMVTIFGENFNPNDEVWIGDSLCTRSVFKTPQRVLVTPSERRVSRTNGSSADAEGRRISFVRDGVVFPSSQFYHDV